MPHLLLVMAGGAIGAGLRFLVGRFTLHQFGPGFPWGTLTVNLAGGLVMGLLIGLLARAVPQLNVLEIGFTLRIVVGLGAMFGFAPLLAPAMEGLFESLDQGLAAMLAAMET